MAKILEKKDLESLETIVINNSELINTDIVSNGKILEISININPDVIDSNFNELDRRLTDVESTIRLRILGELNKLKAKIEK